MDAEGIERIQQNGGSILYYAQAVNMTVLMALSFIAVKQTKATDETMERSIHCLITLPPMKWQRCNFTRRK
jgi:hypothetical protein